MSDLPAAAKLFIDLIANSVGDSPSDSASAGDFPNPASSTPVTYSSIIPSSVLSNIQQSKLHLGRFLNNFSLAKVYDGYLVSPSSPNERFDVIIKGFNKFNMILSGHKVKKNVNTEIEIQRHLTQKAVNVEKRYRGIKDHESDSDSLLEWQYKCRQNFVRLYDAREDCYNHYLILEYYEKDPLSVHIFLSQVITQQDVLKWFDQICRGIYFLHSNNVAHRDLCLDNLVLDENENVKICNFGDSCKANDGQKVASTKESANIDPSLFVDARFTQGCVGKLKYMAPEVHANVSYDPKKADIWSLGIILYAILCRCPPYSSPCEENFYNLCRGGDYLKGMLKENNFLSFDDEILDLFLDLFSHIFCKEESRFSIKQVLEHSVTKKCLAFQMI
jgi:serine/threonine protein kinase